MERNNISICMAAYNGANYIKEQIESILNQMISSDELIICDDGSKDNTIELIKSFDDSRIKLYINEKNLGVNKTFEKLIILGQNDYIFMVDQDDIWMDNRVQKMMESLNNKKSLLVSGNQLFIDENGKPYKHEIVDLKSNESNDKYNNIKKIFLGTASYTGCCMAFKKELRDIIIPFPDYIESHDLWIAKAAILLNSNVHLNDKVLYRRVHGKNVSIVQRELSKKIKSRYIFLKSILELKKRLNKIG